MDCEKYVSRNIYNDCECDPSTDEQREVKKKKDQSLIHIKQVSQTPK